MIRTALWIILAALTILLTAGALFLLTAKTTLQPGPFLTYAGIFIAGFLAASARIAEHLVKGGGDGEKV